MIIFGYAYATSEEELQIRKLITWVILITSFVSFTFIFSVEARIEEGKTYSEHQIYLRLKKGVDSKELDRLLPKNYAVIGRYNRSFIIISKYPIPDEIFHHFKSSTVVEFVERDFHYEPQRNGKETEDDCPGPCIQGSYRPMLLLLILDLIN